MTVTGRNTVSGEALSQFIGRIEALREQKADIREQEKAVFAEARAAGFDGPTMRTVLKRRAMKPHDLQEALALVDMYMHALGMDADTPLFRSVGRMAVDPAAREQVIAALQTLVPSQGEIIVKIGNDPVRLWRDKDGAPQCEDYREPTPAAAAPSKPAERPAAAPVPDCTADEAVEMGRDAARKNEPIIANPFPWNDARRARWDEGWRDGSGTDGMGPPDDR